ncbi:hypothetical protein B296_00020400 [Ensete ventricosum]|uniref:Uncharacterized protein n=1 Tax=Ensete ventricosum TaxID=4639 RepID=A0A427B168_ENSVE|nr:hypothetical protein B296_00020400 [Ensete ventricosum]
MGDEGRRRKEMRREERGGEEMGREGEATRVETVPAGGKQATIGHVERPAGQHLVASGSSGLGLRLLSQRRLWVFRPFRLTRPDLGREIARSYGPDCEFNNLVCALLRCSRRRSKLTIIDRFRVVTSGSNRYLVVSPSSGQFTYRSADRPVHTARYGKPY